MGCCFSRNYNSDHCHHHIIDNSDTIYHHSNEKSYCNKDYVSYTYPAAGNKSYYFPSQKYSHNPYL